MNTALIGAQDIMQDVCEFIGDTTHKHARFIMKQIQNCYSELNVFHTPGFCVSTKTFPYNQVLNFPDGCVYVTKIAIKYNNKVVFLNRDYNPDIIPELNGHDALNYVNSVMKSCDGTFTPFYDSMGELVYKAYGSGASCKSMYVIDRESRKVYLGSNWPRECQVVVEYKTSGITRNNLYPIEFKGSLYQYALWQYFLKKKDRLYIEHERYYKEQRFKLTDLLQFQPIDYIASLFEQDRGTIKNYPNE